MKAYIFDPLWDDLITEELLKSIEQAGVEVHVTKDIAPLSTCEELFKGTEERILCLNPDYVSWKLVSSDYQNIPNLKAILGAATSTSWIDKTFANANNIPICDIRNFSTDSVAEWAITMMFNVARQIPLLIKNGFPLDFDKDYMKYRGIELKGKRVGIVGLGHIGAAIATKCEGLGMDVCYWSRNKKDTSYKRVELEELFSSCDVIIPALELNDETKKIITDDLVRSMGPETIFISVVHELFNQDLVLELVKQAKIFGFGFEAEPKSFSNYEGNVWAAPAYAWATKQTMHNSMVKWVKNMVDAAEGNFPNRIN